MNKCYFKITPPPPANPTLGQNAGLFHNHLVAYIVDTINNENFLPWSVDFALYNINRLLTDNLISQNDKTLLNDLISIVWTDFLTPLDVKNEIQTKADYVKSQSTKDLVVAISNIASSSVGMWYDNGQPSANNPTLGITVPTYRGDVEGGLVGAVGGGIVGGVTAGLPGAVIGATAGAIIVGGSVSAYNWIVDSVC